MYLPSKTLLVVLSGYYWLFRATLLVAMIVASINIPLSVVSDVQMMRIYAVILVTSSILTVMGRKYYHVKMGRVMRLKRMVELSRSFTGGNLYRSVTVGKSTYWVEHRSTNVVTILIAAENKRQSVVIRIDDEGFVAWKDDLQGVFIYPEHKKAPTLGSASAQYPKLNHRDMMERLNKVLLLDAQPSYK